MPEYTIRNFKSFLGHEGHGFNLSLYRDGIKVAFVVDSANGGDFEYSWEDREQPQVDIHITGWEGKPVTFKGTPEEKIFREFCESLPEVKSDIDSSMMKVDDDLFISRLIDEYLSKQWLQKKLKKFFLFQIGNDIGTNKYQTIPRNPNTTQEKVIEFIGKKYPNQKFKLV